LGQIACPAFDGRLRLIAGRSFSDAYGICAIIFKKTDSWKIMEKKRFQAWFSGLGRLSASQLRLFPHISQHLRKRQML